MCAARSAPPWVWKPWAPGCRAGGGGVIEEPSFAALGRSATHPASPTGPTSRLSWRAPLSQAESDLCVSGSSPGRRTVGRTVEVADAPQSKALGVERQISYYDWLCVEIYESARKHGIDDDDIVHAVDHALAVYDIGEDDDEPIRSLRLDPTGQACSRSSCWSSMTDAAWRSTPCACADGIKNC